MRNVFAASENRLPVWRQVLDVAAVIAIIAASAVVIRGHLGTAAVPPRSGLREPPPVPTQPISVAGAATMGRADARVAIIEYSDFECPFCARFATLTLPEIKSNYINTGRVLLAFRHLPLPNHAFANKAATLASCADRQGQFWSVHDSLFGLSSRLDDASLGAIGEAARLDQKALAACVAGVGRDDVARDIQMARSLGISGTPTFMVGTFLQDGTVEVKKLLPGAVSVERFSEVLDELLAPHSSR